MNRLKKTELSVEDKLIMCITTRQGEENPDAVVPGCIVGECCLCQEPIYVAPTSQEAVKKDPDFLLGCMNCVLKEIVKNDAPLHLKFLPGALKNAVDHLKNLAKKRTERN